MRQMGDEQAVPAGVRGEWLKANLFGFGAGFALHGLIGYGLAGAQGFSLSAPQILTRILGFMAAGACVALFQRRALRRIAPGLAGGGILRGSLLTAAGFLLGLYLFGIPFDNFAGFAALGLSAGMMLRGREAVRAQWVWTCTIGFALAGFVAVFAAVPVYLSGAHEAGLGGHLTLWLVNGIVGGGAAGLLTSPWLENLLSIAGCEDHAAPGALRRAAERRSLLPEAHPLAPPPFNFQ
jgi:hypothetical protein